MAMSVEAVVVVVKKVAGVSKGLTVILQLMLTPACEQRRSAKTELAFPWKNKDLILALC